MLKRFWENFRKPEGWGGKLIIWSMNIAHGSGARWGLRQFEITKDARVLDVGCGGGKNIARMLRQAHDGNVCGLDYSSVSVEQSRKLNSKAVLSGRGLIKEGSVSAIPWPDGIFDVVTAFETIFFWPDILNDLQEVNRVLKPGGTFLIRSELTESPITKSSFYQYFVKTLDMKLYSSGELETALKKTGFSDVKITTGTGYKSCVVAKKPGR
jgi:ubiquinone/menaquinone biosynthesis C-methylase UbiE